LGNKYGNDNVKRVCFKSHILESLVELEISRQPPGTDLDLIVEIVKDSEEYHKAHAGIQRKVDETIQKLKNRYQNASERELSSDFTSMSSSASSQLGYSV